MSKKLLYNVLAVLMLVSLVLAACGAPAPAATEAPAAAPAATEAPAVATEAPAGKLLVGISMPTKSSTRWISDGESMVKEFEAMGYDTDLQFADNDIPNQLAQIENMVTKGAKVLVIA